MLSALSFLCCLLPGSPCALEGGFCLASGVMWHVHAILCFIFFMLPDVFADYIAICQHFSVDNLTQLLQESGSWLLAAFYTVEVSSCWWGALVSSCWWGALVSSCWWGALVSSCWWGALVSSCWWGALVSSCWWGALVSSCWWGALVSSCWLGALVSKYLAFLAGRYKP